MALLDDRPATDTAAIPDWTGSAPRTRWVLRRTFAVYLAACVVGSIPAWLDWSASWRAGGLGLWFPGSGFVAVGGWAVLLVVPALAVFGVSIGAWFGAGMTVAPVAAWLGAAALAAVLANGDGWDGARIAIPALAIVSLTGLYLRHRYRRAHQMRRRDARNAAFETEVPVVRTSLEAAVARHSADGPGELTAEQLAGVRYALDLARQPLDDWTGFVRIDQFQTSALRYQINQLGWVLAVAQSAYTPSFHGVVSDGQRRLVDRYLRPEVLGYWRWERLWGHLRWSADPVGRDNIMLTGYFGLNLALYMGNTGDHRYLQDDSLTFEVSSRRRYQHSAADVQGSLLDNYRHYADDFLLYPCEPNWIYSACNLRGAATLAAFDRMMGTDHWARMSDRFRENLESEFMTPDGGVVALRSRLTGFPMPFPMPDSVLAKELNPVLPDLAHRYWAVVRTEAIDLVDGTHRFDLPGTNVDFGNYTLSDSFALDGLLGSAREMGDSDVADAVLDAMHSSGAYEIVDGVLHLDGGSTLLHATVAMDQLLEPNGWRNAVTVPVPEAIRNGPILEEAPYPDVLVARAVSDGDDLHVVLRPGTAPGRCTVTASRLMPGKTYNVVGAMRAEVRAQADGRASIPVDVAGRTQIHIQPAP